MAAQDYVRALCPVHVTNRKDAWNIAEVTRIRGNKVVDKEIKMGNRLTGYARGRCVLSANEVLKNCTRMEPPRLASEYPGT